MTTRSVFGLRGRSANLRVWWVVLVATIPLWPTRALEAGQNGESFRCGDVDGSQSINLGDVVYLLSWLFHDGTVFPCAPRSCGDVNGDDETDISDALSLLLWLFDGGLEPRCPGSRGRQPSGWDAEVRVATAQDIDPHPDIVEVHLEARVSGITVRPHVETSVWTYNGSVPGPAIEAEVGDLLVVHFTNSLPEETTIHWHGLDVPARMDGSPIAAEPVAAGGGTFTYRIPLLRAGTFWYHSGVSAHVQVERGLYGPLVVRDPDEDRRLGLPADELILVLDDILLDPSGRIAPPFPLSPIQNADTQINGREGSWFLVNGRVFPSVDVRSGAPVRLRLINASNTRFFRVSINEVDFYRVGGDGGLIETPVRRRPVGLIPNPDFPDVGDGGGGHETEISDPDPHLGVLLVPGERGDVVFTPRGPAESEIYLMWHDVPRGLQATAIGPDGLSTSRFHDDGARPPVFIMRFVFTADSQVDVDEYVPPARLRVIDRIDISDAAILPVTLGHHPPDLWGDVTSFATLVEGRGVPFSALDPDQALHAVVGRTYLWEITNLSAVDQAFHTHGFSFQVIEIESVDLDDAIGRRVERPVVLENKDTLRIPRRPGAAGRSSSVARLAVCFDDTGRVGSVAASGKVPGADRSGGWLARSSILEHEARGMATFLNLTER